MKQEAVATLENRDRNLRGQSNRAAIARLMARYRTENLSGISPQAFRARIDGFLAMEDAEMEGYGDAGAQRDLSIRFHWGHDHDFGAFALPGRMHRRHIVLLTTFCDQFGLPIDLAGKRVLDIGCWTGGTSLLLAAMGAEVLAIEEVRKYAEAARFLKDSFAIGNLTVEARSLYECNAPEFFDRFDFILFAGGTYHLTDPVLGLRIAFNALKDGGSAFVETLGIGTQGNRLAYQGPALVSGGDKASLNRGGWNWFVPSPHVLAQMMRDAGFAEVKVGALDKGRRIHAVATRDRHRDMNRAGLSVPRIR